MRRLLFAFFLLVTLGNAQSVRIDHGSNQGLNTISVTGLNTTGATILTACVNQLQSSPGTFGDSKGNTWVPLTSKVNPGSLDQTTIYYASAATGAFTVGTSHDFTNTGTGSANAMQVAAFDVNSSLVTENGNDGGAGTVTTIAAGNVTPGAINQLIIACNGNLDTGTMIINGSFSISDQSLAVGGTNYGSALAWLSPGSTSAVNPLWTANVSNSMVATIGIFGIPGALTAGVISKVGNSGLTTINLSTTVATGGSAPYSYQWQRTSHGGSFPGTNICSNSTSCADSGLSTGTTYDYRVVVTDNAAATANSATFAAITLFPVSDSHISMTPGNWLVNGSSYAATNRGGSEFRFGFTGTSAILVVDTAQVSAPANILTAWEVDDAPRSAVTNIAASITLGTGLAGGTHTARFWDVGQGSGVNCWIVNVGTPDYVVKITGIQLDAGAAMAAAPTVPTAKMIFFGDSITAGAAAGPSGSGDFLYAYPIATAYAFNSEPSMSAFSSSGWNVTAGGSNVPPFNSAVGFYWDGEARTLTNVYSRATINLGTNDSGSIGSTIATALTTTRSALGTATKLYVMVPFNQNIAAAMATGLTSYCGRLGPAVTIAGTRTYKTCTGDSKTFFLDFGTDASIGLTGSVSYESTDGTHPNTYTQSKLASFLIEAINQIEGGSGTGPGPIVAH